MSDLYQIAKDFALPASIAISGLAIGIGIRDGLEYVGRSIKYYSRAMAALEAYGREERANDGLLIRRPLSGEALICEVNACTHEFRDDRE